MTTRNHLIGAILLIAGCSIGGGIIGLPVITSLAGFLPSTLALILSWAFMAATGLLLAEVCLWSSGEVSLVTMAKKSVGPIGAIIAWVFFLFLFISLLVAYISASGSILSDFFGRFGLENSPILFSILLTGLVGLFLFLGPAATDGANRILMVGLMGAYLLLITLSAPSITTENLSYVNWKEALFILPPFIVSFGYHNLLPSLSSYLKKDKKKIKIGILIGTLIPFVIYFVWEAVFLGMIPVEGDGGFLEAMEKGTLASQLLRREINHPLTAALAEGFAFFAIVTSFLAVSLGLVDFLADGLHLSSSKKRNRLVLCLLTLGPPLIFGMGNPHLFLKGLQYAGGVGVMVLYGILPVWMVWRGRYVLGQRGQELLPVGKGGLLLILFASLAIITLTLIQELT